MKTARGFSLIELMIGMTIFALLLALAAPSFAAWMRNGRIRTAAESVQNGLQLARSEAVRRNAFVRFQLMTSLDDSCALDAAGPHWVVSVAPAADHCANGASDITPPFIIQRHNGAEGSGNTTLLAAGQNPVLFNGMGRRGLAAGLTIDIQDGAGGVCIADGGTVRCLRIDVSGAGQIRMCDPALPSTDTQGC